MPWVRRPRRPPEEPVLEALAGPPPPPEPTPPPGAVEQMPRPSRMRRERRLLARRREMEIRDVGGLAVEMARRDRFKPDLLLARASDVLQLEERMHELDGLMLAVAAAPRGLRAMPTCRCGAPLLPGAHFCSNCGRPSGATSPVVTCTHCGQPLPADANFCSFCGNAVPAEDLGAPADVDETAIRQWSAGEEA
ncbi:MAG TPA: zinc ribbon domain-containing protein [Gaiellaceae bacterium]|jgi:Double zinc ribbon